MRSEKWTNPCTIEEITKNYPEEHTMILGSTGTGKSRGFIMPMIRLALERNESVLVVDPKGEIYKNTGSFAHKNHKVHVLDFRNICESDGFNILSYPFKLYSSGNPEDMHKASEILDNLSHVLYPEPKNSDPYWTESSRTLFLGLIYTLFNLEQPNWVNINNVLNLFNQGEERYGANSSLLKQFVENSDSKNLDDITFHLNSYLDLMARETKSCIASGMREGLSPFLKSKALRSFLSSDDFKIQELSDDQPTAIYIILPDESPIYYKLAGIILHSITSHYISLAQKNLHGKLNHKLNICIDELGNIGKALSNLPFLLSASRSRNIRIYFVLQSLNQLTDIYGSASETITSNANITVAFRVNNFQTLTELSKRCGQREILYKNRVSAEPLITETQLGSLGLRQSLVIINGREKFIANLMDYSQIYDYDDVPLKKTTKNEIISRPFDFKAHVSLVIQAKQIKTISNMSKAQKNAPKKPTSNDSLTNKFRFEPADIDAMLADIDKKIVEFEKKEKEEKAKKAAAKTCPKCGFAKIKGTKKSMKCENCGFTF